MDQIKYMGHTFIPYGNIIGKDAETRWHRLMYRTDTLSPLLKKADGYDYYEFNKETGTASDIYYCPEAKGLYVPTSGGLCSIDVAETRKYIKLLGQDYDSLKRYFEWEESAAEADMIVGEANAEEDNENDMEV